MAPRRDDLAYRWQESLEVGDSTCIHCFDPDNEDPLREQNLVYINFLPARDLRMTRADPLFLCTSCQTWSMQVTNAGERTLGEENWI